MLIALCHTDKVLTAGTAAAGPAPRRRPRRPARSRAPGSCSADPTRGRHRRCPAPRRRPCRVRRPGPSSREGVCIADMSRDHCGAGCLILRPWSGSFASLRVLVTGHPPGGQDRTSDGGSRPPNDAPIGGRTGRSATGRDLQDGPAPLVDHARSGESGELTAGFGHRAATTPNPLPTRLSSRASARRAGPFGPTGVPGRPGSTLIRRAVSARGRAPWGRGHP